MQRIPDFDYIKGIAIICVVMGHIILFGLGGNVGDSSINHGTSIFQMPIFFLIAGYFSFKNNVTFDIKDKVIRFLKRSLSLAVPMIIWSNILMIIGNGFIEPHALIGYKPILCGGGYWFFCCLWWCSLLCFLTQLTIHYTRAGNVAQILVWIMPYIVIVIIDRFLSPGESQYISVPHLTSYYRYFIIGYLINQFEILRKLCYNKIVYALCLLAFIIQWYFCRENNIILIFAGGLGACIVLMNVCKLIDADSIVGKTLQHIGRNTLPIYAIHYLFINRLPNFYVTLIGDNFILQLFFTLALSLCIIAVCLVIDRIISFNKYTRLLFFGELKSRYEVL